MTDDDSPRDLVDICDREDFRVNILGCSYCSIGLTKKIECPKQCSFKDQNGFYGCLDIRDDLEIPEGQLMN